MRNPYETPMIDLDTGRPVEETQEQQDRRKLQAHAWRERAERLNKIRAARRLKRKIAKKSIRANR